MILNRLICLKGRSRGLVLELRVQLVSSRYPSDVAGRGDSRTTGRSRLIASGGPPQERSKKESKVDVFLGVVQFDRTGSALASLRSAGPSLTLPD